MVLELLMESNYFYSLFSDLEERSSTPSACFAFPQVNLDAGL